MKRDYVKDVQRFAAGRLRDAEGNAFNVSHDRDIDPLLVQTDGLGNVPAAPLIWRKPCWGRPERYIRAHNMIGIWSDAEEKQHLSESSCDRCRLNCPGTYQSCTKIVDERVASSRDIEVAFDTWLTACGSNLGPRCFTLANGKLWQAFVQAIIDHGGWTNVNDQQVKIERLSLDEANRQKRNASARVRRRRQNDVRTGNAVGATAAYLQTIEAERDRRATEIKSMRGLSGPNGRAIKWLNLPDSSCERIADVWWSREILLQCGQKITGKAIAEHMIAHGRNYGLSCPSLTTRVYDDLKRIEKFESSRAGAPIWESWEYPDHPGVSMTP